MTYRDVTSLNYSINELRTCVRSDDFWRYDIDSSTLLDNLKEISDSFAAS